MNMRFKIVHEAGTVRGMAVVVVSPLEPHERPDEFAVKLLDSCDGVSDLSDVFCGKGARRKAVIFSETVLSILTIADCTWSENAEAAH